MNDAVDNMTMQRNIWRDRALIESSRAQQALVLLQEQHAYVDETTEAAIELVQLSTEAYAIAEAVIMGETGIGGAQ